MNEPQALGALGFASCTFAGFGVGMVAIGLYRLLSAGRRAVRSTTERG